MAKLMEPQDHSFLTFPCIFPIKIIGKNTKKFVAEIKKIIKTYYPQYSSTVQYSDNKNYVSLSVTINVLDKITLDNLYIELSRHKDIKMVL
jgi:uncharacterized protein